MRSIADFKYKWKQWKQNDVTVGFVPTMGYLHQGHTSLMERARQECDIVVISIFVNPLQFGPNEDFEQYPRDEQRDVTIAREAGVDVVFIPDVKEMYGSGMKTNIAVSDITSVMCGANRPGHFDGVATVVNKLFHIVRPDKAYFGMKDAQQVAVVTQMVLDLSMDVEIVPCDIIREEDGLAMSSRNKYLKPEERKQALILSDSLMKVHKWIEEGVTVAQLKQLITAHVDVVPLSEIQYVALYTYPGLKELPAKQKVMDIQETIIVALAVMFGTTRLIDNVVIYGGEHRV
nr:pantoate--beta-alanine ligase [Longirhabdus pacifica]